MKIPFFLLGFLSMLIAASAFARVIEEQVPYEQVVKNIVPGMTFTFPKDFRFEHNGYSTAITYAYNADRTDSCVLGIAADNHVRLSDQLEWKVERSFKNNAHSHQIELVAIVDGVKRMITARCGSGESSVDIFRRAGIKIPETRPVKVEVIRDVQPDAGYDHVRDEGTTIAI